MTTSKQISNYLGRQLWGSDIPIVGYSSITDNEPNTVVFAKKFMPDYVEVLNNHSDILAIVTRQYEGKLFCPHIISNNPRLDFIKTISNFFVTPDVEPGISPSATISENVSIGKNVRIGSNCYIGDDCIVGDGCVLMANVTLVRNVIIGSNSIVKPCTVIGGAGFGFEKDANKVPVHFPHTGKVKIGNNVYIGSNTCIDRATIDTTVIEDNVKIDNLCQIAHNCRIGENTIVTGGACISGGVQIGKNCWIGPNSIIYQQIKVEDNSTVGMGAVVVRKVKEGTTVFGNPAKQTDF